MLKHVTTAAMSGGDNIIIVKVFSLRLSIYSKGWLSAIFGMIVCMLLPMAMVGPDRFNHVFFYLFNVCFHAYLRSGNVNLGS